MKRRIFLLGGYDLEMLKIREIIEKLNLEFYDKKLSWGAKLSDYVDIIGQNKDAEIIGIELIKDIDIDFSYIEIDHHNENVAKKSSIEQIAELLGIELTREQKLTALNDSGYIPAMKEFGANKEEINKIRLMDRQAQGVSEINEKLAIKSISENMRIENAVTIVKSLTSKFSTITDRLYPNESIFIYTDSEFTYYGLNARELGERFQEKYGNKIYFGGSENGFFGAGEKQLSLEEIKEILKEVIDYVRK